MAKKIYGEAPADDDLAVEERPFYSAVPRPNLPAELAESWPAGMEKAVRQWAHEVGLTDAQLKSALDYLAKGFTGKHQRSESARRAGLHALQGKYGDKLEARLAIADEAVEAVSPTLADKLEAAGFYGDPDFVEAFATLGEAMRERGQLVHDVDGGTMSDADAKKELQRLMRSDPYMDSNHRNHRAVVENVNKLAKRVHGETALDLD